MNDPVAPTPGADNGASLPVDERAELAVSAFSSMRRVILLVTVGLVTAAMFAASTVPAFAQPTTITATGVLGAPFFEGQDPEPLYPLTDESTGTTFTLIGSFVDVTPFIGQRVTIQGERVPGIDPFAFFVRQIQLAPAVDGGKLPATGGPSLLLPIIVLTLSSGILGATILRQRKA